MKGSRLMICFIASYFVISSFAWAEEETKMTEAEKETVGNEAKEEELKKSFKLDRIVVTGTKTEHKLKNVPIETILITAEEIERSNAKNVSELVKYVPGFNMSQQSDLMSAMGSKNTIRGMNIESRYLLLLVDGQRVFTGYRSGGMQGAGFVRTISM